VLVCIHSKTLKDRRFSPCNPMQRTGAMGKKKKGSEK